MSRTVSRVGRELLNTLLIVLGTLSAGMGLYGVLLSSNFIDGGVTGVSTLLSRVTPLPLPLWLPVINLPFVAVGYRQIGPAFWSRWQTIHPACSSWCVQTRLRPRGSHRC